MQYGSKSPRPDGPKTALHMQYFQKRKQPPVFRDVCSLSDESPPPSLGGPNPFLRHKIANQLGAGNLTYPRLMTRVFGAETRSPEKKLSGRSWSVHYCPNPVFYNLIDYKSFKKFNLNCIKFLRKSIQF